MGVLSAIFGANPKPEIEKWDDVSSQDLNNYCSRDNNSFPTFEFAMACKEKIELGTKDVHYVHGVHNYGDFDYVVKKFTACADGFQTGHRGLAKACAEGLTRITGVEHAAVIIEDGDQYVIEKSSQ